MSLSSNKEFSIDHSALQKILNNVVDARNIFGATVSISQGGECWTGSAGKMENGNPYFIASVTKLYITALIMKLRAAGVLQLEDRISKYLSADVVKNLHIYKGKEYSDQLTVRHLLAHTSGLPDYFGGKGKDGKRLQDLISAGIDQRWTFEEAIAISKTMKPEFEPGKKGKALYSDTNFQLLGKIIEAITQKSVSENVAEHIIGPLQMTNTYLYSDTQDKGPALFYMKQNELSVPQAMSSFGADGGIVSTSEESIFFLKAFFEGTIFPKSYLSELYCWNRIFFPLEYGIGIMRFKLPRIFSPFKPLPELIGHSGLSGSFSFYAPQLNWYISGTVNQVSDPSRSYKLMLHLINKLNR